MEKTLKNKQHHTKESDFHDFNHDEEEGADFEGDIERREGFSAGSDKKIILLCHCLSRQQERKRSCAGTDES